MAIGILVCTSKQVKTCTHTYTIQSGLNRTKSHTNSSGPQTLQNINNLNETIKTEHLTSIGLLPIHVYSSLFFIHITQTMDH